MTQESRYIMPCGMQAVGFKAPETILAWASASEGHLSAVPRGMTPTFEHTMCKGTKVAAFAAAILRLQDQRHIEMKEVRVLVRLNA
jgi:hypothetical protein